MVGASSVGDRHQELDRQQEHGQSGLYYYAIEESSLPDISHPLITQEPKYGDNLLPSQNEKCFFKAVH